MSATMSRRSMLRASIVVLLGAAIGFVMARRSDAAKEGSAAAAANGYGPSPATPGKKPLAALDDLPDGGGAVFRDQHIVLTRDGDSLHAFSSTCTHQGCTVSEVTEGGIRCPCHGSVFDATTGDVLSGPAARPLPTVAVTVRDGSVYRTEA